jgi:hypothetical protein
MCVLIVALGVKIGELCHCIWLRACDCKHMQIQHKFNPSLVSKVHETHLVASDASACWHRDQLNDQIGTCVNRGGRGICRSVVEANVLSMSGCPKECAYGLARYSLQMCIPGTGRAHANQEAGWCGRQAKVLEREKEKGLLVCYLCFDSPTTKYEHSGCLARHGLAQVRHGPAGPGRAGQGTGPCSAGLHAWQTAQTRHYGLLFVPGWPDKHSQSSRPDKLGEMLRPVCNILGVGH